jgi:hypothetical protein
VTEGGPTSNEPVEVAAGVCGDTCNPDISYSCQAGLSCLARSEGSSEYICWNNSICAASVTQPDNPPVVTEGPVSTEAPQECGAGWLPSGGCVCCGSTLTCADGTVAQFNPQCMDGAPAAVCGNAVCEASETCWTCSMDCGPC